MAQVLWRAAPVKAPATFIHTVGHPPGESSAHIHAEVATNLFTASWEPRALFERCVIGRTAGPSATCEVPWGSDEGWV